MEGGSRLRCPASSSCSVCAEVGRSAALSELFALRSSLRHAVSRERQGGAERRRGELPRPQRSSGRCPRCQRAERQLHLAAGRRAGGVPERGNRRDAGARDAACLAASAAPREVWWLHGARDRKSQSFATEVRELLGKLARGRRQVWYSQPAPEDRVGREYDAAGRVGMQALEELGVPRGATSTCAGRRASWPPSGRA
jgi:hypothetical protein